ncbi:hypothetical protein SESBI_11940 [Sesbania bispinosa]|nr:hypothetical protein SESBI_11940 [Sesbania bispinosa]
MATVVVLMDMEEVTHLKTREVLVEVIIPKCVAIVAKQGIQLTHYRKHGFPPHFKFKNQNNDLSLANVVYQIDNPNGDEKKIEGPKADMQSQHFGFTIEQYIGLLALLQQSQS